MRSPAEALRHLAHVTTAHDHRAPPSSGRVRVGRLTLDTVHACLSRAPGAERHAAILSRIQHAQPAGSSRVCTFYLLEDVDTLRWVLLHLEPLIQTVGPEDYGNRRLHREAFPLRRFIYALRERLNELERR